MSSFDYLKQWTINKKILTKIADTKINAKAVVDWK